MNVRKIKPEICRPIGISRTKVMNTITCNTNTYSINLDDFKVSLSFKKLDIILLCARSCNRIQWRCHTFLARISNFGEANNEKG